MKKDLPKEIADILAEDKRRTDENNTVFNPITGEGAILERFEFRLSDFSLPVQYLPVTMQSIPLIKQLAEAGSIRKFLTDYIAVKYSDEEKNKVVEQFVRLRAKHDFCFWTALLIYIKAKGGGDDILFRLNRPQRKLIAAYEEKRINGLPIRVILLKARQWGGSTATQMYMAWLQLVHKVGLNSLIIAHQGTASDEINDMFSRMIDSYPVAWLHDLGEAYSNNEPKYVGVGKSGNIHRVPQRNCKIKIGTAERPDSCRGGDYNLVHLSEVGLWKKTDGKKPEDIVRSACSGILLKPYTMIVYESTANGTGNFFQIEYDDAKNGRTQFQALFVAWYEIELYSMPVANKEDFARWLWENHESDITDSNREEPGRYLWWLWQQGATLENIQWYITERSKYTDHGDFASEYPSDDDEAFNYSGDKVFDKYLVAKLRVSCRPPRWVGEVYADYDSGKNALKNVRFREDRQGMLHIWSRPEYYDDEIITNRYVVVVDIGGRSRKADWSVICVIDRMPMIEGDRPIIVAQWYGHIDMDLLAWKAAQIATFYDNALLVIESNTLETKDKERIVDGEQAMFILEQLKGVYDNLYARKQSADDIKNKVPVKYGFHTNVATKPMVISTLVKVVRDRLYTERDARCLDEYLTYERKENGAFGAIQGKHDDLLMTRAIGLHICYYEMPMPQRKPRVRPVGKRSRIINEATIS